MKAFFNSPVSEILMVIDGAVDVAIWGDEATTVIEGVPMVVMHAIGMLADNRIDTLRSVYQNL